MFGRSVVHAPNQGSLRRVGKFSNRASIRSAVHCFEHLKQPPALSLIPFGVQDAFTFKVHIINERVTSLWGSRQAIELLLYIGAIGRRRFIQHFWKRALQSGNEKFGLKTDRIGEESPQLLHIRSVLRWKKFRARIPRTRLIAAAEERW